MEDGCDHYPVEEVAELAAVLEEADPMVEVS